MKKLAILALLVGCTSDGSSPPIEGEPRQHMAESQNPTFTLFVSNQSLDRQVLDIQIYIDGQLAVSGDFNVFSPSAGERCGGAPLPQHNWYEFPFALPVGEHVIEVISDDVTTTLNANVSNGANPFGVIDYWYDATTDEPEKFLFHPFATEPAFL